MNDKEIDVLFKKLAEQQAAHDYIEGARAAASGLLLEGEHSKSYIDGYNKTKEAYERQAARERSHIIAKYFNDLADKYGRDAVDKMISNMIHGINPFLENNKDNK